MMPLEGFMDEEKPRRSTGIRYDNKQWMAMRTAFVVKGYSFDQIVEEFGACRGSVKRRASLEGWTQQRKNIGKESQKAVADSMKEHATASLALHASLPDRIALEIDKGLDEIEGMKPGRSKAETLKVYAEASDRVIRLGRLVRGFTDGEASTDEQEEAGFRVEQRRLEPKAIAVDAGGRAIEQNN